MGFHVDVSSRQLEPTRSGLEMYIWEHAHAFSYRKGRNHLKGDGEGERGPRTEPAKDTGTMPRCEGRKQHTREESRSPEGGTVHSAACRRGRDARSVGNTSSPGNVAAVVVKAGPGASSR